MKKENIKNESVDRNKTKKMSNVQKQEKINSNIEKERKKQVSFANSEIGEDVTMYGEFISTYFAWIPPTKQKERAEKLQNMTEKDNRNKNKKTFSTREKIIRKKIIQSKSIWKRYYYSKKKATEE